MANVALFLDRCGEYIVGPPDDAHMLKDCETVVLEAADVYKLVVKFVFG